jgi:hypothetical protein
MSFCSGCRNRLTAEDVFCPSCGEKVPAFTSEPVKKPKPKKTKEPFPKKTLAIVLCLTLVLGLVSGGAVYLHARRNGPSGNSGIGGTESGNRGAAIEPKTAYAKVLDEFADYCNNKGYLDDGFGYAFRDIDGDGADELFLCQDDGGVDVVAIYTLQKGEPTELWRRNDDDHANRYDCSIDHSGTVHIAYSGGGVGFIQIFRLEAGKLIFVKSIDQHRENDPNAEFGYAWPSRLILGGAQEPGDINTAHGGETQTITEDEYSELAEGEFSSSGAEQRLMIILIDGLMEKEPQGQSFPTKKQQVSASVGDIITFGSYEWLVLDVKDGNALLLAKAIIEGRKYGEPMDNVAWANCKIRAYLNGEFYSRFSTTDRERIQLTSLSNNSNPWYGTSGGSETNDYIFLLSLDEVVKYFGGSGALNNRVGKERWLHDQYNNNRKAYFNGRSHLWWTRTPGQYPFDTVVGVANDGTVNIDGYVQEEYNGGVRPAMWITL